MTLRDDLAATVKTMQDIVDQSKQENRDLTPEEVEIIETKSTEADEMRVRLDRVEKSASRVRELSTLGKSIVDEDDAGDAVTQNSAVVPLGERFVKSDPYKSFQKQHPSGLGAGTPIEIGRVKVATMNEFMSLRKTAAITSDIAFIQPVRYPPVDLVARPALTLLDLISTGTTQGSFEYVQITAITRGAAIVPEATDDTTATSLKPLSSLTTALADAKVYTYADGFVVTNALLSDAPAVATYLQNELRYNVENVIEDKLLNGTGTNGEPTGILNTNGVQQQPIASTAPIDIVKAVRQAITKVTVLQGGTVTGVLLSPEDDEAIDLMQDGNDRFYGQGPFGTGPQTLWGRPRVVSERIDPGTFVVGDFRQVAFLDREGLTVQAFNQHKDYAQRNLVYIRAEARGAQVIWKPAHLVVGEVAVIP